MAGFNRRGDSLGGAAWLRYPAGPLMLVSIAGAILWGVLHGDRVPLPAPTGCFNRRGDSLGGAARRGVLRRVGNGGFNRRGDSLGGAALVTNDVMPNWWGVSIAGAILWGVLLGASPLGSSTISRFNRRGDSLGGAAGAAAVLLTCRAGVSIAGAILWGVLPPEAWRRPPTAQFQSQGRFFGGCCHRRLPRTCDPQ